MDDLDGITLGRCDSCESGEVMVEPQTGLCVSCATKEIKMSDLERFNPEMNGEDICFARDDENGQFVYYEQARYHLAEVNKRIKALENPWVSVDERLPEPMLSVFVLLDESEVDSDFIDSEGKWYMGDAEGGTELSVTHWMPIPIIPESTND